MCLGSVFPSVHNVPSYSSKPLSLELILKFQCCLFFEMFLIVPSGVSHFHIASPRNQEFSPNFSEVYFNRMLFRKARIDFFFLSRSAGSFWKRVHCFQQGLRGNYALLKGRNHNSNRAPSYCEAAINVCGRKFPTVKGP